MTIAYNVEMAPVYRQTLLDNFSREMVNFGPEMDSVLLQCSCKDTGRSWVFPLHPEKIKACFMDALGGPLQLMREKVEEIAKFKDFNPKVVVSGGSAKNAWLRSNVIELCAANDLPEPLFTDVFEIIYEFVAAGTPPPHPWGLISG
jgi:hypothetical protein